MIGVLVNAAGVLVGGSIGLLAKKGIPPNWSQVMLKGIALCVIYIGVAGSLSGENTLILILFMAVGTLIEQGLDLDRRLTDLANGLEKRFKKEGDTPSVAEGFVTSSLLFCVGALTVVAPFMGDVVIGEMTCTGSVLILGMGLNMLGLTRLKIMNYLPAIFLPIGFVPLYHWIVGLF